MAATAPVTPELPSSAAAQDRPRFSRAYRAWLLTMLVLVSALNLADRQGLAASAQALKTDLKFTDAQLGLIQGLGFAIFYTLMGLPLARLAERYSRTRIIAACVGIFGVMVSLCSTAQGFGRLLLFRIGVGIGDGGFGPPVASLVGDHYPMGRRASAMAIIWLGAPLGVVTGSVLGGYLAEHYGWRTTFMVIGAAGIAVSLLVLLTLREPPRGGFDPAATARGAPPPVLTVFRFLLSKPAMRHTLIAAALAGTAMNGIGQFLNPFLARNYQLGPAEVGRLLGMIAGVSMASGLLVGGFGVDWAGRSDRRWYVWGPALGLLLATPLFIVGFTRESLGVAVGILIFAHVSMFVYYSPTLALAQNMVGANMRASSAFVVSGLVMGLVGIGLGPTLVGVLSDHLATAQFADYLASCPGGRAPPGSLAVLADSCRNAAAAGIRHALIIMALLCVWSAVHYALAARTLRADLDRHYEGA
ncbi:MAG TPA: MFS transporter [Steroidobacteraceae bacterium]|nr:MFS transporter [Steroidobacteraceae bacterium]